MYWQVNRHVYGHVIGHFYGLLCRHKPGCMCIDMSIDLCVDKRTGMHTRMTKDKWSDLCAKVCTDLYAQLSGAIQRHLHSGCTALMWSCMTSCCMHEAVSSTKTSREIELALMWPCRTSYHMHRWRVPPSCRPSVHLHRPSSKMQGRAKALDTSATLPV